MKNNSASKEIKLFQCIDCEALYQSIVNVCDCDISNAFSFRIIYAYTDQRRKISDNIPYADIIKPALERIRETMCQTTGVIDGLIVTRLEGRISAEDYDNFVRLATIQAPEREVINPTLFALIKQLATGPEDGVLPKGGKEIFRGFVNSIEAEAPAREIVSLEHYAKIYCDSYYEYNILDRRGYTRQQFIGKFWERLKPLVKHFLDAAGVNYE